jgi:hypothetical protein
MKEQIKHEIFITLQFLSILVITVLAVFAVWIFEITYDSESHINIYEAWRSRLPFFTKIIIWFSIFSFIRFITVGLIAWRRKELE